MSFSTKKVGLGGQIGFSQNENPTQLLIPNNLFEYEMKKKSLYKAY